MDFKLNEVKTGFGRTASLSGWIGTECGTLFVESDMLLFLDFCPFEGIFLSKVLRERFELNFKMGLDLFGGSCFEFMVVKVK